MKGENNKTEDLVIKNEKLIDIWGRRNPRFERKYEDNVIKVLSEFGRRASEITNDRGKLFGNGYEPYIIAFFIGLYSNKKMPLGDDTKDLRYPLQNWGNVETRGLRKAYSRLRTYIFIALIAKTEIDWIALDKGDIKVESVVTSMIETMEEYANYGFSVMEDKLNNDPGYFFDSRRFLDLFFNLTRKAEVQNMQSDEPEEL